jgi:hypothetical protein
MITTFTYTDIKAICHSHPSFISIQRISFFTANVIQTRNHIQIKISLPPILQIFLNASSINLTRRTNRLEQLKNSTLHLCNQFHNRTTKAQNLQLRPNFKKKSSHSTRIIRLLSTNILYRMGQFRHRLVTVHHGAHCSRHNGRISLPL